MKALFHRTSAGVLSLFMAASLQAAVAPTGLLCQLMEHPEQTVITDPAPRLGWIYNPSFRLDYQASYQIVVSSSAALANQAAGDMWDSDWILSSNSLNVAYGGAALRPGADYYWRVRVRDSLGAVSAWSAPQHFRTEAQMASPSGAVIYGSSTNAWANRYPLRFTNVAPVRLTNTAAGRWFVDFGQDSFGYVTLHLNGAFSGQTLQARFGEMATNSDSAVRTNPPSGSSVRYGATTVTLQDGDVVYSIRPPNLSGSAVDIRSVAGVVLPFRYLELVGCPANLSAADVVQQRLQYQFDDDASSFDSSSPALNAVWALCKHSMKATSFAGVYVDGDRERKPYEADAYINQLSHYAVDREFTLARYSQEYLLAKPTWPFEWKFHSIFMAWADYMATGNTDVIANHYDTLRTKLFMDRARADGLIKGYPRNNQSVNDDIVDWPTAERDGFVIYSGSYSNFYSSVNNAFYYQSLRMMADMAGAIGKTNDALLYTTNADQVFSSYNSALWNAAGQCYYDGVGSTHSAAHANFFPLAFGLVPASRVTGVLSFLHTKGMAPSVYGAQYLMEALYQSGDADYALNLLTTNGTRGWLNMLSIGSTITTEAWSFSAKANMDWNHAWGAAAGNIIPRYILGLRPSSPGYGQVVIQPQLGTKLAYVQGTVPTIRGPFFIRAELVTNSYRLLANIPGNVQATVMIPTFGAASPVVLVDGTRVSGNVSNGWFAVNNLGSGQHAVWLVAESAPTRASLYGNWAQAWFGTNNSNAALAGETADPDGDGASNLAEFVAGTDPLDARSCFKVSGLGVTNAPASVSVTLAGAAGRAYVLERSQSLASGAWNGVASNSTLPAAGQVQLQDSQPPSDQSFYRVKVSNP
jgi:hypothetical protein